MFASFRFFFPFRPAMSCLFVISIVMQPAVVAEHTRQFAPIPASLEFRVLPVFGSHDHQPSLACKRMIALACTVAASSRDYAVFRSLVQEHARSVRNTLRQQECESRMRVPLNQPAEFLSINSPIAKELAINNVKAGSSNDIAHFIQIVERTPDEAEPVSFHVPTVHFPG